MLGNVEECLHLREFMSWFSQIVRFFVDPPKTGTTHQFLRQFLRQEILVGILRFSLTRDQCVFRPTLLFLFYIILQCSLFQMENRWVHEYTWRKVRPFLYNSFWHFKLLRRINFELFGSSYEFLSLLVRRKANSSLERRRNDLPLGNRRTIRHR